MRHVRYGVDMSLDGFIADEAGGTEFLLSDPTYDAAPYAVDTIAELRRDTGKDIWLCGGGTLFRSLLSARIVDTVELGVSPVLLRRPGVPMVASDLALPAAVSLELTRHQAFPSGLLVLEYTVRDRVI